MERRWKVGELARATGLTVRTLHHYDETSLLRPSERTPAGHRLYTEADVHRLYSIAALRGVGFPLAEIGRLLDGGGAGPLDATRRRLEELDRQAAAQQRLRRKLTALLTQLEGDEEATSEKLIEL